MKNKLRGFNDFVKVNEDKEAKSVPLRGYPSETMIERISALMEIMPDRVKFGVPSDNKGYSITYRDANGAIQKIKDIDHYYSNRGEEVKYYCWNISYAGSWDATKSLRSKIDEEGGFGKPTNMNLKKILDYFSKNPEDVDNVRSISISIDSKSIRKAASSQSDSENPYPQQEKSSKPGVEEEVEETEESENE